jgi:putative inorganic carbon (HCO3(-)) transporter
MNGFRRVMPVMYPTVFGPDSITTDPAHSHNQLLQAALDLGLPGLIAYLAIWMGAAALLYTVARRKRNPPHRLVATALAAGILAHFLFGMVDAIPLGSKAGVFTWMMLGLVVGLHRVSAGSKHSRHDSRTRLGDQTLRDPAE